jgi:hypothetical protein
MNRFRPQATRSKPTDPEIEAVIDWEVSIQFLTPDPVVLGIGILETTGRVDLKSQGDPILAVGVLARPTMSRLTSSEELFNGLSSSVIQMFVDAALDALPEGIELTPLLCLGPMPDGAAFGVQQPVRVLHTVLPGATAGLAHDQDLYCIAVSLGNSSADLSQIPRLVGSSNLFMFVSGIFLESMARARWDHWTDGLRSLVEDLPVEMKYQVRAGDLSYEEDGWGKIRVEMLLGPPEVPGLYTLDLIPSTDRSGDKILLKGTLRLRLVQVWDPTGAEIDVKSLGESGKPSFRSFGLVADIFGNQETTFGLEPPSLADFSQVRRLVRTLAARVLQPLYWPTLDSLYVENVEGEISSPAGAVAVRSNLDFRDPITTVDSTRAPV